MWQRGFLKEKVGYNIVGFISEDDSLKIGQALNPRSVIGRYDDILVYVRKKDKQDYCSSCRRRGRLTYGYLLKCKLGGTGR